MNALTILLLLLKYKWKIMTKMIKHKHRNIHLIQDKYLETYLILLVKNGGFIIRPTDIIALMNSSVV